APAGDPAAGRDSNPIQRAFPPGVEVTDQQDGHEDQHFDEPEQAQRVVLHGPRVEEDDFQVEYQVQHGQHVVADVEAVAGVADARHAALVRLQLDRVGVAGPDQ